MEPLAAFLTGQYADPETVQQSLRYLVAELSAADPVAMRAELSAHSSAAEVDQAVAALAGDSAALDGAALYALSLAWPVDGNEDRLRRIVPDAKEKLPVIEAGLLALVTLYGLYLFTTKGVVRTERVVERKADGSLVERETTTYHQPAEVLRVIPRLITGLAQPRVPVGDDAERQEP